MERGEGEEEGGEEEDGGEGAEQEEGGDGEDAGGHRLVEGSEGWLVSACGVAEKRKKKGKGFEKEGRKMIFLSAEWEERKG